MRAVYDRCGQEIEATAVRLAPDELTWGNAGPHSPLPDLAKDGLGARGLKANGQNTKRQAAVDLC